MIIKTRKKTRKIIVNSDLYVFTIKSFISFPQYIWQVLSRFSFVDLCVFAEPQE